MEISGEQDKEEEEEGAMPKEVSIVPVSDSEKLVYQILNGPNEHCLENFRMDKPVFYKLCDILQTRGLLRHTNRIKIEEQLAIFLFIVGHNLRTRAVQELFGYSGETISRHFNNVLNANLPGFMAPYHGVSGQGAKEIFNERHRLLHGAVDRAFGALKERFPILLSAPPYPLQTQVKLVIAACALHNYVRLEKPDDLVFRMFGQDAVAEDGGVAAALEEENQGEIERHEHGSFRPQQVEDCLRLRDEIASHLWDHYVQNLSAF
ncbi:unnamed protein product [Microthlaspi erraticum]|uniref:Uncharacterized protein n=1 Tax=Microthlaspi erraticum TaxID=1685480 RepID=A0A6D2IK25_9BRAS|nr:unnamed protein product [Microthlaspi erraticum]